MRNTNPSGLAKKREINKAYKANQELGKRVGLWAAEHGEDYQVPDIITSQLTDESWHNDSCPKFTIGEAMHKWLETNDNIPTLFVEHPDPQQREGGKRFFVLGWKGGAEDDYFEFDEAEPAIAKLRELSEQNPPNDAPPVNVPALDGAKAMTVDPRGGEYGAYYLYDLSVKKKKADGTLAYEMKFDDREQMFRWMHEEGIDANGFLESDKFEALVELLKQAGIHSSYEYPGYIAIGNWAFGTANEYWSGDYHKQDGTFVTSVGLDAKSSGWMPSVIAPLILKALKEAAGEVLFEACTYAEAALLRDEKATDICRQAQALDFVRIAMNIAKGGPRE